MLKPHPSRPVAFVSGHLDLTEAEFNEHYVPRLRELYLSGASFVVGDAPGCDLMAQQFLTDLDMGCAHRRPEVTVYHMLEKPRNLYCRFMDEPFSLRGGYGTDETRDAAMTANSTVDVAWVRPVRRHRKSGTAKNLQRRRDTDAFKRLQEIASWPAVKVGVVELYPIYHVTALAEDEDFVRQSMSDDGMPIATAPPRIPQALIDRMHAADKEFFDVQRELERLLREQEAI